MSVYLLKFLGFAKSFLKREKRKRNIMIALSCFFWNQSFTSFNNTRHLNFLSLGGLNILSVKWTLFKKNQLGRISKTHSGNLVF